MLSKIAVRSLRAIRAPQLTSSAARVTSRSLSTTKICKGGDHHAPAPIIVGPGGKAGEVPTDLEQAAGLERIELLADLEGREFFDMKPLNMTHLGTKKDPIVVESQDPLRYVGCTGFPVDSHDTIWLTLESSHEFDRCPECGSVFKLKEVEGPELPHGALLEDNPTEPAKIDF